uniref:Uncharacterized protein n=1 Tax=Oryza meridionalis TaxID=40149 RepID=A0A0E0CYK0_9ORYZ
MTTTAAVSGDDDHNEMGIWGRCRGVRPNEATRGAPTPPTRVFEPWLYDSRAQARRFKRSLCKRASSLRNHALGCQLGSAPTWSRETTGQSGALYMA